MIRTLKEGDLVTQTELAEIVRKSRQAVNEMVKRGRLNVNGGFIIYDDTCKSYIERSRRRKHEIQD
jgi:polyhydroxyalkanoate synthesis regulator phasin